MSGYISAEQYMRQRLDGTFSRLVEGGRVIVEEVDRDFIPIFRVYNPQSAAMFSPTNEWEPDDDQRLLEMKAANAPTRFIAYKLDRSMAAVKKRLSVLRKRKASHTCADISSAGE
jgi:hypothetical protein